MLTSLVTGSTKGIGKSTAILLAKKGFNVIICSRNMDNVKKTVSEINSLKNLSGKAVGYKCDVSDSEDVINLVNKIIDQFGKIDVLINNAGIAVYKNIMETTLDDWSNTININLSGCFLFCKAVLPFMIKNNSGTIINISSGAGKMGFPKLAAYCASKFGIMGLSESIAKEVTSTDIRVMVIAPGEIDTDMLADIVNSGFKLVTKKEHLYSGDDVARKILQMIEQKEKFSNGQVVEFYSGMRD